MWHGQHYILHSSSIPSYANNGKSKLHVLAPVHISIVTVIRFLLSHFKLFMFWIYYCLNECQCPCAHLAVRVQLRHCSNDLIFITMHPYCSKQNIRTVSNHCKRNMNNEWRLLTQAKFKWLCLFFFEFVFHYTKTFHYGNSVWFFVLPLFVDEVW